MKRILLTLLCLGVLGTITGCAVGSSASGVSSPERYGVGAYQRELSSDDGSKTQGAAQVDRRHGSAQDGGYWQWQQDLSQAYKTTPE